MGNTLCERKQKSNSVKMNGKSIDMITNCKMVAQILHNRFLTMNWEEFQRTFNFDEKYGVCFDWFSVPLTPYFDQWIDVCREVPQLVQNNQIKARVESLPHLDITSLKTDKEKIKVMSQLIFIVNGYLFHDYPNVPQSLPKNVAVPLMLLANNLGTKPSMGWAQNMCNWSLINETKGHLDVSNLKLLFSFTGKDDEEIFYILSNIADFRFARAIKAAFKANQVAIAFLQHNLYQMQTSFFLNYFLEGNQRSYEYPKQVDDHFREEKESLTQLEPILNQLLHHEESILETVLDCFQIMTAEMNEITQSLKHMFHRNDPNFFYGTLRNYLQGFARKDVFPNGLHFEGIEQIAETEGGSGGNSPSFQIFERTIGIWFDSDLENVQKIMRQGMLRSHIKLIEFMRRNSVLRTYALITRSQSIKDAYNNVVRAYIGFNSKHLYFVEHFIENQIKKRDPNIETSQCKGTGDVCLQIIKDRYQEFDKYCIS